MNQLPNGPSPRLTTTFGKTMDKKIKVKVQRYFVEQFAAEADRRHLPVHLDLGGDVHTDTYVMDTPLGRMRLAASGSPIMLHVYRKFEDVGRARERLGGCQSFNRHSGKWNTWWTGRLLGTDAKGAKLPHGDDAASWVRTFVEEVFAEVDALETSGDTVP